MTLRRLAIGNLRMIASADLELPPGTTLLSGANAQGKTTVLEAAAFLSRGRSFRAVRDRECVAWHLPAGEFAHVEGEFDRAGFQHRVRVAIDGHGKNVWMDGKALRTLTELWGRLPTVVFVPADLRLLQGEPKVRRTFLDTLAGQTASAALADLADYAKALASRASLLRRRVSPADPQYGAFERQMARAGARIVAHRSQLVAELTAAAAVPLARLSGGSERLEIKLASRWPEKSRIPDLLAAGLLAELEGALAEMWQRERAEDCARFATRFGPHRDDMAVLLNGSDAKTYASQGQTRCCVLALRLAELALLERHGGAKPLLLLDDVLGELDRERAERFLGMVAEAGVQALITATDAAAVEGRLAIEKRYCVEGGKVVSKV